MLFPKIVFPFYKISELLYFFANWRILMSDNNSEGSHGRVAGRDGKAGRPGNQIFKYNRRDLTYNEMIKMPRRDGDLFAVFQNGAGDIGVLYSREEDFLENALNQISYNHTNISKETDPRDVYFIIGSLMISRISNFDFFGFMHLLDFELNEIFDMRNLIEWTVMNNALFASPAEEAVMRDAEKSADMQDEYLRQEKVGS